MRVESAVLECYEEGGEMAVLLESQVLVLSPLAAFIVATAGREGVTMGNLHQALVVEFGDPPGPAPRAATEAAVKSLVQTGVLRIAL